MKIYRRGIWGIAAGLAITVGALINASSADSSVIKKVQTTNKIVAFTYDDGPHYQSTPKLLEVLRQKQVKATMFVTGMHVERYPELVAQMVADGHEIASHGYSHKFLAKESPQVRSEEIARAEAAISLVAPKPGLFRPPGGSYNDAVTAELKSRGYKNVLWSVDPRDWSVPSVGQMVDTVMKNIKPGSIVIMHDGQYPLPTAQATGIIIDRLRADGYTIVTVGELLQYHEERKF